MVETPYFQSFHDFCVWDYDYDYYCGLDRSVSFNHSPQKESMQSTFHVVCGCLEYRIWLKTGLSTQSQSIYRVTRGWCGKRTICLRYTSPLAHLYFLRGRPTALICVYQTECVWQSTPIVVLRTTKYEYPKVHSRKIDSEVQSTWLGTPYTPFQHLPYDDHDLHGELPSRFDYGRITPE